MQGLLSVNGGWSAWGEWSKCNVFCGGGESTKQRNCNQPEPQHGGEDCSSDGSSDTESKSCNTHDCTGMPKLLLSQQSCSAY